MLIVGNIHLIAKSMKCLVILFNNSFDCFPSAQQILPTESELTALWAKT